jgi:hypothetical protein
MFLGKQSYNFHAVEKASEFIVNNKKQMALPCSSVGLISREKSLPKNKKMADTFIIGVYTEVNLGKKARWPAKKHYQVLAIFLTPIEVLSSGEILPGPFETCRYEGLF